MAGDSLRYRDPWAKADAWRKHPVFSRRAQLRAMFPGLGIATVAFTAYVIADNLVNPSSIDKLKEQALKGAEGPTFWQAVTGNTAKAKGGEE